MDKKCNQLEKEYENTLNEAVKNMLSWDDDEIISLLPSVHSVVLKKYLEVIETTNKDLKLRLMNDMRDLKLKLEDVMENLNKVDHSPSKEYENTVNGIVKSMLSWDDETIILKIPTAPIVVLRRYLKVIEVSNKDLKLKLDGVMEDLNKADHSWDDGASASGLVFGNVSNASTLANQVTDDGKNRFTANPRHSGFVAEQANHLYDTITGHKTKFVGDMVDENTGVRVKDGADRIVDGVEIQSKYCKTGSACVNECFTDEGDFRYWDSKGNPMQIEVPSDKYDAAVQAMEEKIRRGQIKGVTDPSEAKNIIRKGHFTYDQVKNIARAGTVESITFDAVNGAIVATYAFGISSALSFAVSLWNGKDFETSLKSAASAGLKVGGVTFISAVLAGQMMKVGLNSALVSSSEAIVSIMGPKASALLVNAFRNGANIYGAAAMKSAAKLLRGNAITGIATVAVLSTFDVVNIFRGRISGKQLFKNIATTGATVVGGTAGWVGGAAAGAAIGSAVPIIGTAIGGILGSIGAGTVSSKVSSAVLGAFIEDDADEMVKIIEREFQQTAEDFLLNQSEAEHIVDKLKEKLTGKTLKDMFESKNRKKFAHNLLVGSVENEVSKRQYIKLPSDLEMINGLREVLEEISDENIA
ncbi:MAG: hypothetical protein LBG15_10780 [Dysgonamonadaceae bacterium]|jgi:hypothetical protein|nr:hypothetical protein [Dysgonamonadaceae bacterium]